MKSWSYKAITEYTEKEIQRLVARAEESQRLDPLGPIPIEQHWAYGVFIMWRNITMGWQNDGDSERLEALVKYDKKRA